MKILLITRPWSFHGGVETATAGLLGALVEHGYEVEVLSPGSPAPLAGLTVHRLRVPPLPPAARALAIAALAKVIVARGRWDVVQSHERTLGQDVYRAGEGCHRGYLESRSGPPARRVYHQVLLGLEARVFARTPRLVAIARRGKDEIERLYGVPPARVSVVYNGVDLQRFHPDTRAVHRARAREEAGLSAHAWVALFVGSGFERKGLGTAIEALAALRDPASHLLVVGKGDQRPYQALAERLGVGERMGWLGAREDVERWYAAADALVLPARYEPFGNVHLEALASGLPVVTSTRAGGSEVIEEGVSGAVREPDDPAGIAQALGHLRERPPGEVRDFARQAAEPFTYARQVHGFAVVYRERTRARGEAP
jgi:UDP-glucose:(heptosyl)LPS alpha-1,3-glucosyltransferase